MENKASLNKRSEQLLKLLVESYISDGQPVGSKTLAEKVSLTMSPATIRNIMADLEDAGFINSPHTSSGRVPTVRGYRFFVDGLLRAQLPVDSDNINPGVKLPQDSDIKGLITAASSLLSTATKLTGLVMLPSQGTSILRQIEFLPLSGNRVLVVLVMDHSEVQNRVIYTDRCYTEGELKQIGNFLTTQFSGKELCQIRYELIAALDDERSNISELTQSIVDLTSKTLDESDKQRDYIVTGETNLFNFADYSGAQKLKDLFAAFAEKRDILHLLNQCLHADGVKIYIGEESGYGPLGDSSIITTPYHRNGKVVGVLGIIGPTRMPYERAIEAVDVTAKLLSAALAEE